MAFYYPRRLGIRRPKPEKSRDGLSKSPPPRHCDVWREGVGAVWTEYEELPEDRVLRHLETAPTGKFTLILGEPGAGKTRLVENWFVQLITKAAQQAHLGMIVPALIYLRRVPPSTWQINSENKFADALWNFATTEKALVSEGPHAEAIADLYREHGHFFHPLWLFDGLDELPNKIADDHFYKRLINLPGRKMVSARTAVYQSIRDVADRFKDHEYEVMGLKPEDQHRFLHQAVAAIDGDKPGTAQRAQELFRKIQSNTTVRLLAGNPLMLSLMAQVTSDEERNIEFPESRALFYEKAVNRLWYRKLRDRPELLRLTKERDLFLTQRAAGLGLAKLQGNLKTTAVLEQALRTSGLVRIDEEDRRFEFIHLTFQEYFLARSLAEKGLQPALEQHWSDSRYSETLGLLISVLFQQVRYHEIEEGIIWLIEWGQETHKRDPQFLWKIGRSPLRIALHILGRSAIHLGSSHLPRLQDILRRYVTEGDRSKRLAVATDTAMPALVLERLASDPDEFVRGYVTENANTPALVLERLASDPADIFRVSVAANDNTPALVLERLASDPDEDVRYYVASNANTPAAVLEHLACDTDEDVRRCVANNDNTPALVLECLASDPVDVVRAVVALNDNTPALVLERLAIDPDEQVRRNVTSNANTPAAVLERLTCDTDEDVRRYVAVNTNTPALLLERLASDSKKEVRKSVASNANTPAAVLERLACDTDEDVRGYVAENANTPALVLERLASDPADIFRSTGTWNDKMPDGVLERRASDPDKIVRRRVAMQADSPTLLLERLASDLDPGVRSFVAENANTSASVLERLASDPYHLVRQNVAKHANTPALMLKHLASDPDQLVRINVAMNPNALLEDL